MYGSLDRKIILEDGSFKRFAECTTDDAESAHRRAQAAAEACQRAAGAQERAADYLERSGAETLEALRARGDYHATVLLTRLLVAELDFAEFADD